MTTEAQRKKWISEAVDYIRAKKANDEMLDGWAQEEGQHQPLRNEVRDRLKDALKKAEALEKELYPLMMMADELPFHGMDRLIHEAFNGAIEASTSCRLALSERLPEQRRGKPYHLIAVKLALAVDETRAPTIAEEIIRLAGLGEYSDQSMANWLRDAKKELGIN